MRRSFVAVVVSWLVVVAIGSTLVWAVISHVGDGLVTTADTPRSSSVDSGTTRTPSANPSTGPSVAPSATPTADPPGNPPSSPPSEPQQATWRGLGGTIVAECSKGAISPVSVQPDPGFRAEVGNSGPEELEVEFEGREDEEGSGSHVRAECVSGAPRFAAEIED